MWSGLKRGYIDQTGSFVIEPRFDDAGDFSEGLAPVAVPGEPGLSKAGYIDRTGAWVIEPRFGWAQSFSSGLALVSLDRTGPRLLSDIRRPTAAGPPVSLAGAHPQLSTRLGSLSRLRTP